MRELEIEAKKENLDQVLEIVDEELEQLECTIKEQTQIDIAVEEIFVNIASYAYAPSVGTALIRMEVERDPLAVVLTFEDKGTPYDPLAKEDPSMDHAADETKIGGLGIYMVKRSMDDMKYEDKDGKNILVIKKILQ